jgi:hypothetical protein
MNKRAYNYLFLFSAFISRPTALLSSHKASVLIKMTQEVNKIGKLYCSEYAYIVQAFFTPHHAPRCCSNVIRGHCCILSRSSTNVSPGHCCVLTHCDNRTLGSYCHATTGSNNGTFDPMLQADRHTCSSLTLESENLKRKNTVWTVVQGDQILKTKKRDTFTNDV